MRKLFWIWAQELGRLPYHLNDCFSKYICISVILIDRKGGNKIIDGGGSSEEEGDGDEVWLFHFGPVDSREEYL